jgi:EpsI family protein
MNRALDAEAAVLAKPATPNFFRLVTLAVLLLVALAASELLRPTKRLADIRGPVLLESQIPKVFGDWRVDPSLVPLLPSPTVQAQLNAIYTQVLARTYINAKGERVMLSIAYGSDQGSEATAVHRPEFCYSAQGFRVSDRGEATLSLDSHAIPVRWLVGSLGSRIEPISYWVTLDESATLPGIGRKLNQLRYGLRGEIPDGMLVRVSNISSADPNLSYEVHANFVRQLYAAVPEQVRARYFGR